MAFFILLNVHCETHSALVFLSLSHTGGSVEDFALMQLIKHLSWDLKHDQGSGLTDNLFFTHPNATVTQESHCLLYHQHANESKSHNSHSSA